MSAKVVQVPSQGTDIGNLDRVVVRKLILYRQVHRLNVWSLEVALTPIQVHPLSAGYSRILQVDGCKCIFQRRSLTVRELKRALGVGSIESHLIEEGIIGT